jgi:predicted esterase
METIFPSAFVLTNASHHPISISGQVDEKKISRWNLWRDEGKKGKGRGQMKAC